jgi:hypothetical protein
MEADMKVIRVGRLCLLAFMVLGAIAAGTASAAPYEPRALPEVGRCVKVAAGEGEFMGSKCLTVEKGTVGKWNWAPASVTENITFEGGGTPVKLATSGHETLECVVGNAKGTFTGPKTANAELELQGCLNQKAEPCGSIGNENQIKSNPLEAVLGFIQNIVVEGHRHVKVGLDFKPQPPLTSLFNYKCGPGTQTGLPTTAVEGSLIVADKPIDTMKQENKLIFHVRQNGTQDPENFQGEPKDTLSTTFTNGIETTGPFASTLGIKEYVGKYSVPMEIKAIEK